MHPLGTFKSARPKEVHCSPARGVSRPPGSVRHCRLAKNGSSIAWPRQRTSADAANVQDAAAGVRLRRGGARPPAPWRAGRRERGRADRRGEHRDDRPPGSPESG
eukprot:scaffold1988_cov270-Prasinococcus_capsulatus_cf.AAC.3